jgi:glutamine amidotransferase
MQMLMDTSEEFGETQGLGLIPGRVIRIPNADVLGNPLKVPHIGWSELRFADDSLGSDRSIFCRIREGDSVYFVHSFMAKPTHQEYMAAYCMVGGHKVCAAVRKANVFGCQFHPEKSGNVGLLIIEEYLSTL